MTIIVAKKFKDRIEIAADKTTSSGVTFRFKSKPKITTHGDIILGSAGRTSDIRRIQRLFNKSPEWEGEEELEELLLGFTNDKSFSYSGILIRGEDMYLISINNGEITIEEEDGFVSVGSGCYYAYVAHELTDDLRKIIEVVSIHHSECGLGVQFKSIKFKTGK